jgi:YbgC/YbaW family acyl-CoA thioester hydrolase
MVRFEKSDLGEKKVALFSESLHVRFQDVDAAGVVFFARFFDYVHQGYEALLRKVGVDLPGVLRSKECAATLRHVEADYRAPAFFGDLLAVEMVVAEVEVREISIGWRFTCQSVDS